MYLKASRDQLQQNFNPGPGYYEGPSNPKFNDVYKSSFFQNKKNEQPNMIPFNVQQNRFQEQAIQINDVGPCTYFQNKKTLEQEVKKPKMKNNHNQMSTPSIPHVDHTYLQVEEVVSGNVLLVNSPIKVQKGSKNLSVEQLGPGKYYANHDFIKPKTQGAIINADIKSKPKQETQQTPTSKLFLGSLQPSTQQDDQIEQQLKNLIRKEQADHYKISYNKDKLMRLIPNAQLQEINKHVKIKQIQQQRDQLPSPGQYFNPQQHSSLKVSAPIPENMQCFDFKQKRWSSKQDKTPGPGDYQIQLNEQNKYGTQQFPKSQRFNQKLDQDQVGPGHYDVDYDGFKQIKNQQQVAQPPIFGSGTVRFAKNLDEYQLPGPGSYQPFKNKKNQKRKVVSVQMPPPKITEQQKIQEFIQWVDEQNHDSELSKSNQSYTQKQQKKINHSSAFKSKLDRFKQEKNFMDNVGPGKYSMNQNIVKKTFNSQKEIFNKESKFKSFSNNDQELGPGMYDPNDKIVQKNYKGYIKQQ